MDTKKLRQKILDLAIHGKLVPQDPNNEPASVLLERIRAEKERLIAEGKIKRSKKSATSDTSHYENVPFEVPEGWCWCKLEDIAQSNIGLTYKPADVTTDGTPVLRSNNIQNNKLCLDDVVRVSTEIRANQFVSIGDLLICARNGSRRLVGKCALINSLDEQCSFGAFMAVCKSLYNEWLFYVLCSTYFSQYLDDSNSTTIYQVTQKMLLDLPVPFPPLKEQKRIATEIEKYINLIDLLEESKHDLDLTIFHAKSKILDLAIHGKLVPQDTNDEPASELLKRINPKAVASCDNPQYGKVPSSWVIATVGEIFTINPKTHVEDDTEAAFVPMTCVADGYSNTFEYECRKWGDIKKGFVHFQENDVAVAKISPCLENRKSVVFHDLPNGIGAGTTELNVFRCGEILPEYALFYFKSQMFIGSCAGTYNGVVGQQRVAKSFIQELPIGIPPYKEQLRIVSKVNDLFSQLDLIEKSLQA